MTTEEKKAEFLRYYQDLPKQKLAAGYVGIDEDTVTNWKKSDKVFSDALAKAKSEWARQHVGKIRSNEWLLERVLKEEFAERKGLAGPEGNPIPILTENVSENNSSNKTSESNQED